MLTKKVCGFLQIVVIVGGGGGRRMVSSGRARAPLREAPRGGSESAASTPDARPPARDRRQQPT